MLLCVLLNYYELCLKRKLKKIPTVAAYLHTIQQNAASSYWSHGLILVIILSIWLLNKVHVGVKLTVGTSFLGQFPLDLVFINSKDLVLKLSIFMPYVTTSRERLQGSYLKVTILLVI